MNEKDFLQGYELKNWEFSPRIYKILGVATLFNLLGLFVFAQTNLLSASACESPFVKNVCSVLDTVYVGSKLYSGQKDYVVKDYNQTQISDEDEIVWVNTANVEPQIEYPTGYFQIANRDEIAAQQALLEQQENSFGNTTTFTPTPINPRPAPPPASRTPKYTPRRYPKAKKRRGGLLGSKQKLPKTPKGGVIEGEEDDELYAMGDGKDKKGKNSDEKNQNKDKDKDALAQKSATDSDSVKDVEINRKPLDDFADTVVVKWEKKEIDLNKQFRVRLKARLNEKGRFDPDKNKTRYLFSEGDEQMLSVAKSAIEAIGDSGWLGYISNLGAKDIVITLVQNEDNLVARLQSEVKSESEAKTVASGLGGLLSFAKMNNSNNEDLIKLINLAKAPRAEGKNFILDLVIPKSEAQEMINRNLQEVSAKKQKKENNEKTPKQPNGVNKDKNVGDEKAK